MKYKAGWGEIQFLTLSDDGRKGILKQPLMIHDNGAVGKVTPRLHDKQRSNPYSAAYHTAGTVFSDNLVVNRSMYFMETGIRWKELEEKIGYHFQDPELLKRAMCHSSYANERHMGRLNCNERLEFLGDAVLELATSEFLYERYPQMPEGDATKTRASIVCEQSLAFCARGLSLGRYILLGRGEAGSGGRERPSITSDAFEALIGAIYLDGGFTNAKEFIQRFVLDDLEHKQLFFDSKTILQERIQAHCEELLHYELIREEGPDHQKKFVVQAMLGDKVIGKGQGRTKKAAEQEAAYHALTGKTLY